MRYDYIFTGVGLSSMLILHEMMEADVLKDKKILLLEPQIKDTDDRTWCFWESREGDWDALVSHQWSSAFFLNSELKINCLGKGQKYKMITSSSFYAHILERLKLYPLIVWKKDKMISFAEEENEVVVYSESEKFIGSVLFNSVFDFSKLESDARNPLLHQHFVGWFVKTSQDFINSDTAFFMDFTVPQDGNTRFMYVLPFSPREALVEYTLFSGALLPEDEYESSIVKYLHSKGIENFEIIKKEKGSIPMTTYPFWKHNSKRILNIGTAGGWTKASTGYTFQSAVRESKRVVRFLDNGSLDFSFFYKKRRFLFYDTLFLDVLYRNNELGQVLFSGLFSKVRPETVLRFLDEKSTLFEELKIIWACPKLPFLRALVKRYLNLG